MSFTYQTGTGVGNSGDGLTAVTSNIDTSACNLLVALINSVAFATAKSVSDSKGNTWTPLTNHTANGTSIETQAYYTVPSSVGSGHNFSVSTSSASYPDITLLAFSGADPAAAFDGGETASSRSTSNTSDSAGSITPAHDNDLLISHINWATGVSSPFVGGGFTAPLGASNGSAYLIQTGALAIDPVWAWTTGSVSVTILLTFKALVGAGGVPRILRASSLVPHEAFSYD